MTARPHPLADIERNRPGMSPRTIARLIGILYFVIIAAGIFAEFVVRQSLIVPSDATATATKILASEGLFRAGIAADLIMVLADVGVGLLFYLLFRRMNHTLALLTAFLRLAQGTVLCINLLNLFFGLALLHGSAALGVFDTAQLHALALPFLEAHGMGYALALIFFGVSLLPLGYLLITSRYVPRILGILLLVAALGYLSDSFARVLLVNYSVYQPFFDNVVFLPAFIAELALTLWLLIKGVKVRADASRTEPTTTPAPGMAT